MKIKLTIAIILTLLTVTGCVGRNQVKGQRLDKLEDSWEIYMYDKDRYEEYKVKK